MRFFFLRFARKEQEMYTNLPSYEQLINKLNANEVFFARCIYIECNLSDENSDIVKDVGSK